VHNVLIYGIGSLMGSYFAARCMQMADDQVFYIADATGSLLEEEITDFVSHAACQIGEGGAGFRSRQEIKNRLHGIGRDLRFHAPSGIAPTIDEVWHFANSPSSRSQVEMLKGLISACPTIGAKEFNYVGFDNGGVKLKEIPDEEISERCKAETIGHRIFRTSLVVGNGHPRLEQGTAFSQFLSVLHSLKAEIEERSPQYFNFQALRCLAPGDAVLNLVTAEVASELLLRIARARDTMGSSFAIVSPQNTLFSALCERIGIAYRMGLLAVEDFGALNAIDRVFRERTDGLSGYLMGGAPESPSTEAYRASGLPLDSAPFDEEGQIALFESFRRNQDEAWAESRLRVADLDSRLVNKMIMRDGSELHYYVGGMAGTVVVLLNALGYGLECWRRLMDNLMQSYRVIIWEARGTVSPPPPFGLTDQVDDLDAILQNESVETCHLVGWCTAPKVAIEFYLRRPSVVRSMAFLNSTFKCEGSPEELDSPFEKNLESLFRMLVRKPAMAASVLKTFQSREEESEIDILQGANDEQVGVNVLSRMNRDLKSDVLAPFKTDETTLNYAYQLIDFWSYDSRPKAAGVHVPVLLMGAEYDQAVTPASSQTAAELFPNARHVHVRGATHFCLYDRAEFVGGLLKTFFENPDHLPVARSARDEMVQAR
jgi:pimeloyl-ACP methyl ester carboxylesterase